MAASNDLSRRLEVALASGSARDELVSLMGFATFGTVYYVDADNGDDVANDGLSMDRAFATVLKAYNTTTTNKHDYIVMSAAGAHSFDTTLTVSKSRIHFVGTGGGGRYSGQRTRWEMGTTTGSEISMVTNTGMGNTFTNIKMRSTDDNASSLYTFADGGESTKLTNCALEKDELLATAGTAELLCNSDTAIYDHCTFGNTIYKVTSTTRGCVSFAKNLVSGSSVTRDAIFEDCNFLTLGGATTSCFVYIPGANDIERFLIFKNCIFLNSKLSDQTMALAIRITSNLARAQVLLKDCAVINATDTATTSRGCFTNSPTAVKDGCDTIAVETT